MTRQDAKTLFEITKLQKEFSRGIYPEDLVNKQVLSKRSCQEKVKDLLSKGFLEEANEQGANVYRVTVTGINDMCAYRDIKIEYDKL